MDKQHGKFKNFISKTKDFFLELFYPSNFTCDICGKEMDHETKYHVCEDCEKNYLNNSLNDTKSATSVFVGQRMADLSVTKEKTPPNRRNERLKGKNEAF